MDWKRPREKEGDTDRGIQTTQRQWERMLRAFYIFNCLKQLNIHVWERCAGYLVAKFMIFLITDPSDLNVSEVKLLRDREWVCHKHLIEDLKPNTFLEWVSELMRGWFGRICFLLLLLTPLPKAISDPHFKTTGVFFDQSYKVILLTW